MKIIARTWRGFNDDKVLRLAAALAFSALFAIAPLVVILVAVAGWFLGLGNGGHGHHVAEDALLAQIAQSAGPSSANAVRSLVTAAFNQPRQSTIAQIVGWVTLVLGAAGLFSTVRDALNSIWHIETASGGWRTTLRDRLVSFAMIVVAAALLLATVGFNAAIAMLAARDATNPAIAAAAAQGAIFIVVWVAFACIYRLLPDVRMQWRDVWIGAGVTAVLFVAGEALISLYLARASVASAYGAAGSLLATLLWIYYSAAVFLTGAELTKTIAPWAVTTVAVRVRTLQDRAAGVDPRI